MDGHTEFPTDWTATLDQYSSVSYIGCHFAPRRPCIARVVTTCSSACGEAVYRCRVARTSRDRVVISPTSPRSTLDNLLCVCLARKLAAYSVLRQMTLRRELDRPRYGRELGEYTCVGSVNGRSMVGRVVKIRFLSFAHKLFRKTLLSRGWIVLDWVTTDKHPRSVNSIHMALCTLSFDMNKTIGMEWHFFHGLRWRRLQ